ncbi:MAG: DHH family phosphoesterase [Clostridia bacterium]|nr:DHH family phosphoesterase [Clostridia bacterium]
MEKTIILGHENPDVDSIVSGYLLQKILNIKGYNVEFVIPDEKINEDTLDICTRNGLNPLKFMKKINLEDKGAKYILVDHSERKLSGQIVCIIDHHNENTNIKIDHYYNKMVSSAACFICYGNEELLNEFDLKLAAIATLVDTASFHSTKGRREDKDWVINICNKYNFNYDELAKEGLGITDLDDINKASLNGVKKYTFNGKNIESSYIQTEQPTIVKNEIEQILSILKKRLIDERLDAFVFIVHNVKEFKTMYYLITEREITTRYYSMYTQRGNTIIPEVKKILK